VSQITPILAGRSEHITLQEQLPDENVQWIRGGLIFKALRFFDHPTLGLESNKKERICDRLRQSEEGGSGHHKFTVRRRDHPGDNPGANGWFLESTPVQMPPPAGGICERLT